MLKAKRRAAGPAPRVPVATSPPPPGPIQKEKAPSPPAIMQHFGGRLSATRFARVSGVLGRAALHTASDAVRVEMHGNGVASVVLSRPPHNFLTPDHIGQLADIFEALQEDMSVRCALLRADGRSFCAGADFQTDRLDAKALEGIYEGAARLFDCRLPVVGAIHGPAIGGGLGLALVPDIRIASEDARFAANFAALGIHQGFGLSVTLPELIGPSRAARVLYSARRFKGAEALELGLADEVVVADALHARALSVAAEIASNAPLALRSIKSTLRLGLGDRVREATRREAMEQLRLFHTDDHKEGQAAVRERRAGEFVGR
jgi:enoyl-CoA hydratase/carnithine racemase